MVLITARVTVLPQHWEDARALARRHVAASRLEPGCIAHDCFVDPERERSLVFLERWRDREAIDAHFAEPTSRDLVASFREWCEGEVALELHAIEETQRLVLRDAS